MRRLLYFLLPMVPLAIGCGSAPVSEVNEVVMAKWESLTDDASRRNILLSRQQASLKSEDYRLGPEDVLAISIFEWELREETRTLEARVSQSGCISLPVLGDIPVEGRTVSWVKARLEGILREREILKDPRVYVEMKAFQSKRVSVVGAVQEPGVYTLHQNVTTLLEVLTLAGGPDDRAGQVAHIIRHGEGSGTVRPVKEFVLDVETGCEEEGAPGGSVSQKTTVDLHDLLDLGNLTLDMILVSGDIVHVPEAARFFVFGYVRESGGFPIKRPTTVLDGIAMARGLREREASPEHCVLKRRSPGGEVVIPLDLVAISRGEAPNLFLRSGDIIEVRQTSGKGFWMGIWEGVKAIFSVGMSPL